LNRSDTYGRERVRRRAAVVDRQREWVAAVEHVLGKLGVAVVVAETDLRGAPERIAQARPDLLVVQLRDRPAEDASEVLDCLVRCRQRLPGLRGIVFGESVEPARIEAAFAAGAAAYVAETAGLDEIAAAIRQAFFQSMHFAPTRATGSRHPAALSEQVRVLTPREREVLALIAQGHTNAATARMLFVTEQTVKYHLSNVYTKLNVSNRTQASRWAHEHGLVAA